MEHPNIDKLSENLVAWNKIFPFIEWLHENKMLIAAWRDPKTPYFNSYTGKTGGTLETSAQWLLEHPYPIGYPTENLLYKYFDVDLGELEAERRQILDEARAKQS